ncbi:hypothetical protein [Streptomyces phaeochromogenes]|uniref:hypothetical protein n=1 Tax=Streptomyces phaeochromogenes TaxID=1923 RepID=UPI002DD85AC4|nr:hypothetical protein [Streptomyces phaeochromogenes]WRZ35868.1 hypothetical protein OG931_53215 [Streptomyces phaeochromogenes]
MTFVFTALACGGVIAAIATVPAGSDVLARPLPWEASGHTGSPQAGYQPDGGYHNDNQE